jgi:hypothetical protein
MGVYSLLPFDKDLSYQNIAMVIELIFTSIIKFLVLYMKKFKGISICSSDGNLDCPPMDYTPANIMELKKFSAENIDYLDSGRILAMINVAERLLMIIDKFLEEDRTTAYIIVNYNERLKIMKLLRRAIELIHLNEDSMIQKHGLYTIEDSNMMVVEGDEAKHDKSIQEELNKLIGRVDPKLLPTNPPIPTTSPEETDFFGSKKMWGFFKNSFPKLNISKKTNVIAATPPNVQIEGKEEEEAAAERKPSLDLQEVDNKAVFGKLKKPTPSYRKNNRAKKNPLKRSKRKYALR